MSGVGAVERVRGGGGAVTIVEATRAASAGPLLPFAVRRLCIRRTAWLSDNAIEIGDDWLCWAKASADQDDDFVPCADDILADDWETVEHPSAAGYDAEEAEVSP